MLARSSALLRGRAASALRPLATAPPPDSPQTPAFLVDAQRRTEEELLKLLQRDAPVPTAADAETVDPAQASE
jgi:hypothetical protein